MQGKNAHGCCKKRGGGSSENSPISWDDLRVFIVCAEQHSFRAASRTLNLGLGNSGAQNLIGWNINWANSFSIGSRRAFY